MDDPNTFIKNRSFLSSLKHLNQHGTHRKTFFGRIYNFPEIAKQFAINVIKKASFISSKNQMSHQVQIRDIKCRRKMYGLWITLIEKNKPRYANDQSCIWIDKALQSLRNLHTFLNTHQVCLSQQDTPCQYSSREHCPYVITCENIEECFTASNCLNVLRNHKIPDQLISQSNWKKCQGKFAYNYYAAEGVNAYLRAKKDRTRGLTWTKATENNGKTFFGNGFITGIMGRTGVFVRQTELSASLDEDRSFETNLHNVQVIEVPSEQLNVIRNHDEAFEVIDISEEVILNSYEQHVNDNEADSQILSNVQDLSLEQEEARGICAVTEQDMSKKTEEEKKKFVKLSDLVNQAELIIHKVDNPQDIESCPKKKIQERVYFSKMNKKILSSVIQNHIPSFKDSVTKLYNSSKSEQEDNYPPNPLVWFEKQKCTPCTACFYTIEQDEEILTNKTLVFACSNTECTGFTLMHIKCIEDSLIRNKKTIEEIKKIDNWHICYTPLRTMRKFVFMDCTVCDFYISDVFEYCSTEEKYNQRFKINSNNINCCFCLEENVTLEHFSNCTSIKQPRFNSSSANTDILLSLEIFLNFQNLSASDFIEKIKLTITPYLEYDDTFSYPYNSNTIIQVKIKENESSYRRNTLLLLFKTLSMIVTNLKTYATEGKTNDGFEKLKTDCRKPIQLFIKNSKCVMHRNNCQTTSKCLECIEVDDVQLYTLMNAGTNLFKTLVDEDIELFACITRKTEHTESETHTVSKRNDEIWNTLSYTYNYTNYKSKKNLEHENITYRTKEHVDDLIIGQIETFEDSANAMLPRNNKRKHDDQSNIKSIRYFK